MLAIVAHTLLFAGVASADTAEAKKIFTTRCMACHTFGKGVKVGPDLKGVTERRQRAWIVKFVRGSSTMVGSDPIGVQLFEQFKQQRMPDWVDLSEAQVNGIMDWLAANGPDQQDPDARSAELATAAEIDTGRQLFHGGKPLSLGGLACASCHTIHDEAGASGGVFASDLTSIYSQYQDIAMTVFLKRPCFLRFPESQQPAYLAPEESFALKAYLRSCALANQPPDATTKPATQPLPVAKPVDSTAQGGAAGATGSAAQPASAGKRVAWKPGVTGAPIGGHKVAALPNELLFQIFPYVALAILILGLGIRHALARRRPEAIRPAADAAWHLFRGSAAWRIGLAITTLLHLVFLAVPGSIRAWDGAPMRLYLLEGTGFLFGAIALLGLIQLLMRHIGRSIAASQARVPEIADYALLSVLCVAAVSGLANAALYRWGSSWAAGTLTPYLWSLGKGEPAIALVEQMPFLVRLHVFSWFAVLAVLPFTSAAMILVSAGDRVVLAVGRPITAAAQTGRRVLGKLSPARWLWPEEDHPGDGGDAHEPS
ncbi:MAG TPA: respiratory nitrate reductase subunit gamma [Kofleriaceae bacterium]|nr:respiratory nitrate reductase subunit gamma [Kofleriaceae bacterium]